MNLALLITDNITELLVMIIEFTRARHKILVQNINDIDIPEFVPKDLLTDEFSNLLNNAIDEHIENQRLLLRDTENVKFGINGSFEVEPVVDKCARELLEENRDEYIELQINNLLENTLNQRVAAELLKQKQGMTSVFNTCDMTGCFVEGTGARRWQA
jgi:flagellar basal body rod protein FlgB